MTHTFQEIQDLQRAVYYAHARVVEVETRELGWRADHAREAEEAYNMAVEAYKAAFDMEPEYKEGDDIFKKYPLFDATLKRKMMIASEEV